MLAGRRGDPGAPRARDQPPGGDRGRPHLPRRDEAQLTFLAYGSREPGDLCYFPRSGKVALRGLGVVARLEAVDYWEGED